MNLLILVIVLLLVFGGLPQVSGHFHHLGYGVSGVGLVVVIILIVVLLRGGF